jgi:uncharacterized membrane protein
MIRQLFLYGGITTLILLFLFVLGVVMGFDQLFTLFHYIVFPQGNWQFPADSLLIQTFPLAFFRRVSMTIGIMALILGSFFILLSLSFRHEHHR